MGVNIDKSIEYMKSLMSKGIHYSMTGCRDGLTCNSGDCSGTLVRSIEKAGGTKPAFLYNTDSMHAYLTANGYKLIATNKEWDAKKGDIVIFGKKGASGGASGHVVEFINKTQIIHCTYKNASLNGVFIDNEATTCPYYMGWYVYRLPDTVASPSKPVSVPADTKPDKVSWYFEEGTFTSTRKITIYTDPKTSSKVIAELPSGSKIKYDQFTHKDGLVWIRQPRGNTYGFIPTGESDGTNRKDYWGKFS